MSTLRKHTHSSLCSPHIYVFYSPFPHGSQREATVKQTWADLVMLNRGFLPTSDQHWIVALPPHPKPPDLPSALDGKRPSNHHHHHQRCLSGVKCEMVAERWAACLKEKEVERGGRCRGGVGGENPLYIHTQTAWLAGYPTGTASHFLSTSTTSSSQNSTCSIRRRKNKTKQKPNKQTKQKRRRRLTTGWTTRLKTKTRTRRDDLNLHNRLLTCVSPPSPSPPPPSPNNIHSNWHTMPWLKKT